MALAETPIDDISFLAQSPNRARILDIVRQDGPLSRNELRSRLDGVVRTTVQRNLDALEEQGWIQQDVYQYSITPAGAMVAEAFIDLVDVVSVARQLEEFLQWVPTEEFDLDPQLLADATIHLPKPGDPYAMINRQVELTRQSEYNYGFLRVTGLHAAEAGHEMIVNHGGRAELVVTPEIVDTWRTTPQYAELVGEMLDTGRFQIFVYDGDLPYSLVVIDDIVQITVDEDGDPCALLEAASAEVKKWADQRYETYKQQAEPTGEGLPFMEHG